MTAFCICLSNSKAQSLKMSPRGLRKFKSIKGIRQLFSNTDQDSQSAPAVPLATQQSNTFSLIADGLDTASRQLFMQQPKGALGPPVGSSADIFKSPRSASPKPHSNDATRKTGGLVFVIHSKVVEFERIVAIVSECDDAKVRMLILNVS